MGGEGPLTVGELRKRIEGLDDSRWICINVDSQVTRVSAQGGSGPRPADDKPNFVKLFDGPLVVPAANGVCH